MLDNPDYKNISIENYYHDILQIFILEFSVYVTRSLTIVYLEVIVKIKH